MSNYRYEIKYSLDESMYSEVMVWLLTRTKVRKKYFPRQVNSLYFDDSNYSSIRDNIIGLSERLKYRLRWYKENDNSLLTSPKFEIKQRLGRLGKKKSIDIPTFVTKIESSSFKKIESNLRIELINSGHVFKEYLSPSLAVTYWREYYEDDFGLRITIDKEIKFFCVDALNSNLTKCPQSSHNRYILEIKFDANLKNYASKLISSLNLTPTRHSKYLLGLAKFGEVIYV